MRRSPVGVLLPTFALWRREVIRFLRQRSRVFGALGQPVLFWILLGAGLGGVFQLPASAGDMSYLEYLFPGILILVVLFTAIFSTISIIEDRKSGFLQSVLVAPMPRSGIVSGKILGGTTLALLQALLLLVAVPILGLPLSAGQFMLLGLILFVIAFALTGLGYLIAWSMESTQGFHSIMNLFLIPMWLLSGAFFPAEGLPGWLVWIMYINPLTYGLDLVKYTIYGSGAVQTVSAPYWMAWGITGLFAVIMFAGAVFFTRRRQTGD